MTRKYDHPIRELVEDVNDGLLPLPEMQRPFIWGNDKIRKLLDSLYRGYPTGTILLWDNGKANIPHRSSGIELSGSPTNNRKTRILLDGQQRLTSLTAIIKGKQFVGKDKPIKLLFNICHLEDDEIAKEKAKSEENRKKDYTPFVIARANLEGNPSYLDVTKVFNESFDLDDFYELLEKNFPKLGIKERDKLIERFKKLRDIPDNTDYTTFVLDADMEYDKVAEVFIRLNSQGNKLKESDLALAIVTTKWKGSLEKFEELKLYCSEKLNFEVEMEVLLRNLLVFAVQKTKFEDFENVEVKVLKKAWETSKKALIDAIGFVKDNIKMPSAFFLSSSYILVVLAFYIYKKNVVGKSADLIPEGEALAQWLKIVNIRSRYTGPLGQTLSTDISAIENGDGPTELIELVKRSGMQIKIKKEELFDVNLGGVISKMMFLAFKSLGARDWKSGQEIVLDGAADRHKRQRHHIFPQAFLKKNLDKFDACHKVNDIANISFISADTNKLIGSADPAIYIKEYISWHDNNEEFKKQGIPTDKRLLQVKNYGEFLAKRKEMIAKILNKYISGK